MPEHPRFERKTQNLVVALLTDVAHANSTGKYCSSFFLFISNARTIEMITRHAALSKAEVW